MRKYTLILLIVTLLMTVCGCGATVPDMTEAQRAVVTEYATNLLVKYSTVSERSLLNDKELAEGIAKEEAEREHFLKVKEMEEVYKNGKSEQKKPVTQDTSEETSESPLGEEVTVPQLSVAQFFEQNAFEIDYSSYSLCQSYPEASGDDYFMAMDATPGKKLCVVYFDVKNVSSSEQMLDMYSQSGRFSLKLGDGTVVKAQTTLLMDDLSSYVGTIAAGTEERLVLIFEVPDGVEAVDSMKLIMNGNGGENTLTLE